MNLSFEIDVQCKGKSVGTLGWLNDLLSDGKLVIKNNRSKVPSLFFKEFHDGMGNERKENEGFTFIASVKTVEDIMNTYPCPYETEKLDNDNLLINVYPQSNETNHGFVDYPLTPAALKRLDQFIYEATLKYKEWWLNDGKEE